MTGHIATYSSNVLRVSTVSYLLRGSKNSDIVGGSLQLNLISTHNDLLSGGAMSFHIINVWPVLFWKEYCGSEFWEILKYQKNMTQVWETIHANTRVNLKHGSFNIFYLECNKKANWKIDIRLPGFSLNFLHSKAHWALHYTLLRRIHCEEWQV